MTPPPKSFMMSFDDTHNDIKKERKKKGLKQSNSR